mmetsp:Transcript_31315/g.88801  ORF Transcript_31315/g.88801 Transcript_31315/m.88801 type:complete len:205 (-) Transcript_31315:164-778(-)
MEGCHRGAAATLGGPADGGQAMGGRCCSADGSPGRGGVPPERCSPRACCSSGRCCCSGGASRPPYRYSGFFSKKRSAISGSEGPMESPSRDWSLGSSRTRRCLYAGEEATGLPERSISMSSSREVRVKITASRLASWFPRRTRFCSSRHPARGSRSDTALLDRKSWRSCLHASIPDSEATRLKLRLRYCKLRRCWKPSRLVSRL